ncbi:MAG TPA: MBL fold metallo-hydrolase [Fimbriimonadaceae bacterium]|nr:MBL fold metallo-hydrolase [Fimbriimonadaceae bacterium]
MSATCVVLGSGTSNGVPTPGKAYPPGFLDNPKNHRTRPSIVLCGPEGNVLVDCGPEMRLQLLREGIGSIAACIVTHTHADHIMGMDDLRTFCKRSGHDMPVYTAPRYQEDIRRIFAYAFKEVPDEVWVPRFDLRNVSPVLELCGMSIKTFWVEHGDMPVLGLRLGGFAYVTDVSKIPEEVVPTVSGLDTLILDAVRYRPHPNHFHFERAVEVALALGARQTYFTHLSDDYDHDEVNASLPPGIALAYDGLRIEIP